MTNLIVTLKINKKKKKIKIEKKFKIDDDESDFNKIQI